MEKKYHIIFSFWIILPLLVEAIQVYTMGKGSLYTILLHVFGFVSSIFFLRKDIRISDFKLLLGIYFFYLVNFVLFPENKKYFLDTPVYILLLFYLPIGVFVVRKIIDWNGFFHVFKWFSFVAVLCGMFITMFSNVTALSEYFSYMDFSYFFTPFIAGSYIAFRIEFKLKNLFLFFTVLGLFEILIYGARGAVIFVLVFILLFEIFNRKKGETKFKHVLLLCFFAIALWIFIPLILDELSHISYLSESRFLSKLMNSEMFESEGRRLVYINAEHRLDTMGLDIAGLFGDRKYNDGYWPHNYFYEILMQLGWIFGTIVIIATIVLFIKSIFKSHNSIAALFFITVFFGRYLVSGSYAIEGRFWFMIIALISIVKPYKTNKNIYV